MNRLNLDFSLDTVQERRQFIQEYIDKITFTPTSDELEMMGNYILWGKEDGKSAAEVGAIEVETRHKTWQKKEDESLDALLEQPTFNEAATFVTIPTKIPREVFSRSEALQNAPDTLKGTFEDLFRQIDTLDLVLNFYDLAHGKRKNPPRDELLNAFSYEDQERCRERASHLNQFKYLKMRHELVELRRQQFTLKDSYAQPLQRALPQPTSEAEDLEFGYNLEVFPLGIINSNNFTKLLFQDEQKLIPSNFTEHELQLISKYYWDKHNSYTYVMQNQNNNMFYIDLLNPEHLAQFFLWIEELDGQSNESTQAMLDTINYYVKFSKLSELQQEVLDMKIHKKTNPQIQSYINKKYNKSYTVNYISTIFRQKIIPLIIEGIKYHQEIISNLFFEEEFKVCIGCGRTLLIHPHNFVRKARSHDGFNNKCKCCEKTERKLRMEKNGN